MTKLKNFLISFLLLIFIVTAVFYCLESARSKRIDALYEKLENDYSELKEDYKLFKTLSKRELNQIKDSYEKEREKYKKEIADLEEENRNITKQLEEEKKKIREAEPNYIVVEIGKRIGEEEVAFHLDGFFSLTRRGANSTLFKFVEGEAYEKKYQNQLKLTSSKEKQIESFGKEIRKYQNVIVNKDAKIRKADEVIAKCEETKVALKRKLKMEVWKRWGEGAVGGGLFTLVVLKLLGFI